MSVRVSVIQPPLRISRDVVDYPYHCDLAVAQVAAVLRDAGVEVSVVDAFALGHSAVIDEGDQLVIGCRAAALPIVAADVHVVHYTVFHRPPTRDALLTEVLDLLREAAPDVPIVLADLYQSGQHYIQARVDALLAAFPQVDVVLQHEAEGVIASLCRTLARDGRPTTPYGFSGGELEATQASKTNKRTWCESGGFCTRSFRSRICQTEHSLECSAN